MNQLNSLITNLPLRRLASWFAVASLSAVFVTGAAPLQTSTQFALAQGQQLTNTGRPVLAISPDGTQLVYVANRNLFLKTMSDPEAKAIPGAAAGTAQLTNPVFSPDGKSIAYWSGQDQTLKRIAVTGGTPSTICRAQNPYGMSWGSDDTIVFGQGERGISSVPAAGGTVKTIVNVKDGELAVGPQILPGGGAVLYAVAVDQSKLPIPASLADLLNNAQYRNQLTPAALYDLLDNLNAGPDWDHGRIVVQSLKTNETKTLIQGARDARYSPTGHIVYAKGETLMAVRFDAQRQEVSGTPVVLIDGVTNAGQSSGASHFSFSNTGSLVYISTAAQAATNQRQMAFVDLTGKVTNLRHVPGSLFGPRISPSGNEVAYRDNGAVWIADLHSEAPPRRLTKEPGEGPIWSPDGERIAFISMYKGMEALYWRRADGSGDAELLVERARAPESWVASREEFSFITLIGPSGDLGDYDIWTYSPKDKKASSLIAISTSAQSGSRFSPDGKWIAYESNETGRAEVYVEPLPRTGQRFQITKTGGARPLWSPDGVRLYYDNNAGNDVRLLFVTVQIKPNFSWGEPQTLPMTGFVQPSGTLRRQYDITPDGKQFLVTFPPQQQPLKIDVIPNWFDQLKKK